MNYVQDGRLPIDNNDTERDLRRLKIGRNNWLFIGAPTAGPRAAVIYTVVASAARHDLEIWSNLRNALEQLATTPADITQLLPHHWGQARRDAIRGYRHREREVAAAAKRERQLRRRALERVKDKRR